MDDETSSRLDTLEEQVRILTKLVNIYTADLDREIQHERIMKAKSGRPDGMTIRDIARKYGFTAATVREWTFQDDFPDPIAGADGVGAMVWNERLVTAWYGVHVKRTRSRKALLHKEQEQREKERCKTQSEN